MLCYLDHRSVITLTGEDRVTFIQGFLTQDIYELKKTPLIYSWILSPKGRFLFDVFIFEKDQVIYIDTDQPEMLLKKLQMHKLRSLIDIDISELNVYAGSDDTRDVFFNAKDPRTINMGYRLYSADKLSCTDSIDAYDHLRAQIPLPDGIKDLTIDKSLPLEWQMDIFNAVSFTKGCYVGQELTTRTKHLKMIKRIVKATKDPSTIEPEAILKTYSDFVWYWFAVNERLQDGSI